MHGLGLLQGTKVLPIADAAVVDTANYEGVVFICTFGSADTGNEMQGQQGDESDGSDLADITAAVTDMDGTATVGVLEVHKPVKRYVACDLTNAGTMVAVLYGARKCATTQGTTTNTGSSVGAA